MSKNSHLKFRKIINDLKRSPEDAASDLNISKEKIKKVLNGQEEIGFDLIIFFKK